jgi:alginate O-acetyltransferase complex protein AlgJ
MHRSSMRNSSKRIAAGVILLAVIAAGALVSVMDPAFLRSPGPTGIFDGKWISAWQTAYEQELPVRDTANALWTLLRYGLFQETRPEVLVGSDGWLFSAEELDPPDPLSVPLGIAVQRIASTRDELAAKGIDLVVALVPTKTSVEWRHLGRYTIPLRLEARYEEARGALGKKGIAAPDLLTALREGAASADMYLRTDTHWTPQGAERAAAVLAETIIPLLEGRESPRKPFETEKGAPHEFAGDLLKFVPLGPWQSLGPAPDLVEETLTLSTDDTDDASSLFGDLAIPIALVGTSYSANTISGFEGALKDAVDADVLNVAKEGMGPFAPMSAYLASTAIDNPRPDVVVWEIPERYLIPDSP